MRALISVYDKTGLVPFARKLVDLGWEIVSTGGSAQHLVDAGIEVAPVEAVTGFPEILDGRVKTLHPHVHAGLLARTDLPEHMQTLARLGIAPIGLLVSNLYPFEQSAADPELDDQATIEQIDIGGPAMVRAAAKNFASVVVVTDPRDYDEISASLERGGVDMARRQQLAATAFGHVATYDSLVAEFLRDGKPRFPDELAIGLRKRAPLRYGENPQQEAAAYRTLSTAGERPGILEARQLHGKELSFNNLLDGDAALAACQIGTGPTVSIVKHTIPCGLASRATLADAFEAALDGDPVSAFGGIVALNREVDEGTASRLLRVFFEVVIAPGFAPEALDVITRKKNIRVLECPIQHGGTSTAFDIRSISGGVLVQTTDTAVDDPATWRVVTDTSPTEAERRDLEFAWNAVRLVKSNAIVLARDTAVVGVGAGQPNRVESVNLAIRKAGDKAKGAALASDAFFPFADGVELAASAGVTAIAQPGGSMRDAEVITAANQAGIAMLFTGTRHFRH